jgi:hypothetical protein
MGVWETGLYSGDFALDLRSTVGAVARLPFDGDKLVDILSGTEPRVATNSDDEEHATFWLVVADQFAKRSITCDRARKKAPAIIEHGIDLAMHEKLGMKPSDLAKRREMLEDLRVRLLARRALDAQGRLICVVKVSAIPRRQPLCSSNATGTGLSLTSFTLPLLSRCQTALFNANPLLQLRHPRLGQRIAPLGGWPLGRAEAYHHALRRISLGAAQAAGLMGSVCRRRHRFRVHWCAARSPGCHLRV